MENTKIVGCQVVNPNIEWIDDKSIRAGGFDKYFSNLISDEPNKFFHQYLEGGKKWINPFILVHFTHFSVTYGTGLYLDEAELPANTEQCHKLIDKVPELYKNVGLMISLREYFINLWLDGKSPVVYKNVDNGFKDLLRDADIQPFMKTKIYRVGGDSSLHTQNLLDYLPSKHSRYESYTCSLVPIR